MTSDGSSVYFTTASAGLTESDTSVDLYRADVGGASSASLSRVSTGTGGAGDTDCLHPGAPTGTTRPERTTATWSPSPAAPAWPPATAPSTSSRRRNSTARGRRASRTSSSAGPGSAPHFVATLDPGNLAIHDAVYNNEIHSYGDFQVTPSGEFAAFAHGLPVTGVHDVRPLGDLPLRRRRGRARLRILPAHPGAPDHRHVPHAARPQPQRRRPRLLHLVRAAGAAGHKQPGGRVRVGGRHRRADLDRLQRGRLRHRHGQRGWGQRVLLHPPDARSPGPERQRGEDLRRPRPKGGFPFNPPPDPVQGIGRVPRPRHARPPPAR